jgi:hypothetical protein
MQTLLNIKLYHMYWPSRPRHERSQIERHFCEGKDISSGGVGLVDVCHVVPWQRPGTKDWGDFFNRKGSYSYNERMVADYQKLFGHVKIGFAGLTYKAGAFGHPSFNEEDNGMFDGDQYLLADSAYPPGDHCFPVLKRQAGSMGSPSAKVRVLILTSDLLT